MMPIDAGGDEHGERAGHRPDALAGARSRPQYDSLRYVVGSTRANRFTPSGSIANGNAEPDRNISGKNSRLAIAGAVLMSRAVLPTRRPIGTSAHAPHK